MTSQTSVCLSRIPTREFFLSKYKHVTTTGERPPILTYARHLQPLSVNGIFSVPHLLCLFVCLFEIFRPTWGFFIHMMTSPLQVFRAANFYLCSALISIEQWGYTCCQAYSSGAVTTWFNDLGLSRLGFEHPTIRLRDERSDHLCGLNIIISVYCTVRK